jgi:predicted membrane protein
MKNSILVLVCLCFSASVLAQKKIEKTFNFSGKQLIDLKLQIADSIDVKTWNKNEVMIKASININNNKYNDDYLVDMKESGEGLEIDAHFDSKIKRNWNDDSCDCNYRSEIYWEIYMPEKTRISLETINGNIVITGQTSEMKVSTISGYIDLVIPSDLQADLKMSTITGTIYTNVAMNDLGKSSKHSGSDVVSKYNGGGKPVNLKTISGDIFLRKP